MKEYILSPPIYTYLFLLFSSLILSKVVFRLNTALSKAPSLDKKLHTSRLPKKISKDFTHKI